MTQDDSFATLLAGMRPRLHRYCARMTGSAIDGEDVVQETLIKALAARSSAADIANVEGWLFRVAHNASLDFLRARARIQEVPLIEDMEPGTEGPQPDIVAIGFRTFLQLAVLQRCAVILKDVLGHSVEEIAQVADCSVPAAKSALQRGRQRLRELVAQGGDRHQPVPLSDDDHERLRHYVAHFQAGDFDAIRRMLADDARLDLVNRLKLQGRKEVDFYFTRYAEAVHWRFALGAVEGRPAMLVYDARGPMDRPAHFVLLTWRAEGVARIQDYLFAPYVMETADWVRLDPIS